MTFRSTKTFGHELGLSCCFRQWRAQSHCRFLHGYALKIRLEFEAKELDDTNWVVDFGSLSSFKELLKDTFDHKLVIAEDDPLKDELASLSGLGLADSIILPAVGCERFAEYVFKLAEKWLLDIGLFWRVHIALVEVSEHGANSAIYMGDKDS